MNIISEMLTNSLYPVKLSVTRQQAFEIIRDFETSWDNSKSFEIHGMTQGPAAGWCYAHYMTRKGKQKRCLVLWNGF